MRGESTNGQVLLCLIGTVMLIAAPFVTHAFGLYTGGITLVAGTVLAVWFRGPQ